MTSEARQINSAGNASVILLADDEEVVRKVGRDILNILGYEAILASNGVEAAALYEQNHQRIGLIILDWYMPGISGSEVLQRVWKVNKDAKVLIASGMGPPREMQDLISAGHSVFLLQKPYLVKDLQTELARLLR
jgi:CheY-like chemotaxis protein